MPTFAIGDRVRFTRQYLRFTDQRHSAEAHKVWTVTGYSGPWVITDERLDADYVRSYWTDEELAADPTLAFRRINPGNLVRCS